MRIKTLLCLDGVLVRAPGRFRNDFRARFPVTIEARVTTGDHHTPLKSEEPKTATVSVPALTTALQAGTTPNE